CDLLDPSGNAETVHRFQAQYLEDEHIECPLNYVRIGAVHRSNHRIAAPHHDCQDMNVMFTGIQSSAKPPLSQGDRRSTNGNPFEPPAGRKGCTSAKQESHTAREPQPLKSATNAQSGSKLRSA